MHRVHIRANLYALSVKEGNGKDLCRLDNVANRHLQALAPTKQEITESFTTSMLELKLDQATMFELQRHRQDFKDVLHYSALLDFINLMAHISEKAICESDHKCQTPAAERKCYLQIPSYAVACL